MIPYTATSVLKKLLKLIENFQTPIFFIRRFLACKTPHEFFNAFIRMQKCQFIAKLSALNTLAIKNTNTQYTQIEYLSLSIPSNQFYLKRPENYFQILTSSWASSMVKCL